MARVLLVEDERGIRDTFHIFLEDRGHRVDTSETIEDARSLLETRRYDVVVSDILFPRESGLDLLVFIRNRDLDSEVIMITGEPTIRATVTAMRLGAFDFLAKPIMGMELCDIVEQAAARKEKRDRQKAALSESEARFRRLAENAKDLIWRTDMEGRVEYVNPAVENLLGYRAEEIIGCSRADYLPPEFDEFAMKELERVLAEGGEKLHLRGEMDYIHKDGHRVPFEINATIIRGEDGTPVAIEGISRDVSERKRSHANLAALIESSDALIASFDEEQRLLVFNAAFAERFRAATGRLPKTGERIRDSLSKSAHAFWSAQVGRVMAGERFHEEFEVDLSGKGARVLEIHYTPIVQDGRIAGFATHAQDITSRKRTESRLRQLNDFQRGILDSADIWLNVLDKQANVVVWNKAAEGISGYRQEEVVGHGRIWEWLYPDSGYRALIFRKVQAILHEKDRAESLETVIRRKDGLRRVISWDSKDLHDDFGRVIGSIALGRDVTDQSILADGEDRREWYDRILHAVTPGLKSFRSVRTDEEIQDALKWIGETVEADRSYLFLFRKDGKRMANTHEWCAGGVSRERDHLQDLDLDRDLPWFAPRIRSLETIHIPDVDALPDEAARERRHFQQQSIRSLLVAPVAVEGRLVGFLGFDSVKKRREWSEDAMQILRLIGDLFRRSVERIDGLFP